MKIDSLDELKAAFSEWRRKKAHVRERVPEELRARALRASQQHGVTAVVGVTRVERTRLFRATPAARRRRRASAEPKGLPMSVPTFSRLELSAPSAARPRPIAEVETTSGVTLRVFEQTPETLGLLSAACGIGEMR